MSDARDETTDASVPTDGDVGEPNPSASPKTGDGPTHEPNGQTMTSRTHEQIAQLQRERDEYYDQLQRSRAEFANFQKRSKSQADAERAYAVGTLARDLLEAIDNLERAAEALKTSTSPALSEGLLMVHRQLLGILAKHGVEPIEALGQPFDPNQHEALVQQPDAEHPEGTVVSELSKGYRIRDRVLRPTKVAVSIKPS